MGRGTLEEVRDGLRVRWGGPGRVGGDIEEVRDGSENLREILDG